MVTCKSYRARRLDIDVDEMVRLYEEGRTAAELARHFRAQTRAIFRRLEGRVIIREHDNGRDLARLQELAVKFGVTLLPIKKPPTRS